MIDAIRHEVGNGYKRSLRSTTAGARALTLWLFSMMCRKRDNRDGGEWGCELKPERDTANG
jgi:hypothetical protein